MNEQSKRGKALSLALTASLVATLNVPAVAFAEEADTQTGGGSSWQVAEQGPTGSELDGAGVENVKVASSDAGDDAAAGAEGVESDAAVPQASTMLLSGETDTTQAVASVAGKEYSSLNDALAAAKDGDTVKVLADTTMTTGRVDGKSITLDLNGCSVQVDNRAFNVVNKGTLTLDDAAGAGSLVVKKNGALSLGIVTGSGGSFVMKGGTLEVPEYGVYITNGCNGDLISMQGGVVKAAYGLCAVGNGTEHSARIEISGGEVTGSTFGVATNGSAPGVDVVMTGGTVTSTGEGAPAMYLPAPKSTTAISGGVVKGDAGIEIRAGDLTVSGDAQISGTGKLEVNPNGNGSTSSGAAIAVAQHTTKEPINVTVSGNAKLVGTTAVYESNPQKNDTTSIAKVKLSLEGGTFETTAKDAEGVNAVYSEDCTGFVSGGTFNTELPVAAVAAGRAMLVDENGAAAVMTETDAEAKAGAAVVKDGEKVYYTTPAAAENANPGDGADKPQIEVYVASVNGAKYTSLADAVNAAAEGAEVTLVADVAESLTVPAGKNIVLDLAGYTLSGGDNGKGGVNNAITNNGILTIKDSSSAKTGTVMGGTDSGSGTAGRAGIALVNEGTCVIESGTVKRGDDGTFGNYTVYNKEAGTMTIKGGAVTNNSNTSSLIRNDGAMEIAGGEITQMKFNAVKNDVGKLTVTDGVITSGYQALQNWCEATIKGGTFNGGVYTWACAIPDEVPAGYRFRTVIEGGTINGDVAAVNYDGSDELAQVVISGPAKINGDVVAYDRSSGSMQPAENGDGVSVQISDGTFAGKVDADFVVPGSGLQVDESGNLAAVDAKLVANGDKVVDGVYTYDVTGAKEITEADLLALVGMNVDVEKSGYAVKVDASNLPALNKAIGAKDTKATFSFVYTAVKDGVQTFATGDAVEPLTVTVKLVDSSSTGDSGAGNAGGTAGSAGDDQGSKDKAALAATGDDATVAAGVAGAAALAGAAVAAGAVALSRRRSID